MRKRSWNYYLGLAAGVHGLLIALLAFAGLGWLSGEPEEKPAIEVGFVAETAVASMAGGSEAGGEAPKMGPAIKTASVAAVEKLQSLRGHSAEAASNPAVSAADRENAVEEATAAIDAASTGAEVDGKGSAGVGANGGSTDGDNGSGSAEGTGGSGTGTSQGLGAGFTPNGDGTYTAASAAGIDYQLLRDANAVYPEEARSIGYSNVVEVVARIMVGLDGSVESVTILNSPPKLGFREAAQEALWSMRFAPIYYQGVNIRVPFEKHVIFQP
ncbi:energy transducer TonB [Selenomonas ruminantium]|uniref:Outer membrane transport energization protein TonB n=1 Tax=Selenomonas ruminantium TaxID=971 RepID=A0A1H0UKN9_SELRU|nr:energy transducer TonB [Selenomonas ruminantium]SDP66518.1 outer membrane transport energization protein TonB [Selenomonas ruminantium]